MAVTVETFGVHHMWLIDPPEALLAELRRAHTLRNALRTCGYIKTAIHTVYEEYIGIPALSVQNLRAAVHSAPEGVSGRIRLAEIRLRLDYAPGRSAFAADRYQRAAYQFPRYAQRVHNVEFPFQFFRGRILLLQYPMIL